MSAKGLGFVSGTLASQQSAGKAFVVNGQDEGPRLLVIGRRELVTKTVFGLLVDEGPDWLGFAPALALADGDPLDVVYATTQPVKADRRVAIRATVEGRPRNLGAYHVNKRTIVAQEASGTWSLVSEPPLHLADLPGAARHSELAALLANFRSSRNMWPRLKGPWLAIEKNVTEPIQAIQFRQRVTGPVAAASDPDGARFLESGHEHLKLVLRIADVYGVQFSSDFSCLDWGVGCGRIGRHMPRELQRGFVGIDVDPINIGWCKEHLPFGRYEQIDPFQRTPFASQAFDLVYSHSVLTHLGEQDQFFWLKELARISRGLMILSVHGLFSVQTANWAKKADELWDYLLRGFRDSGRENPDIRDVAPSGYYRGVAHTPAYIVSNWSRFVQVIDIIPGGFGNLQDAVVCRPLAP